MESKQDGRRRTPSFVRSVTMYAGFLLALAVIAILSTATGGVTTQTAVAAQAALATPGSARIETFSGDPSLPSAPEALTSPASASPAEAVAPTF